MAKSILIIGADSTIGHALAAAAMADGIRVTGTSRRPGSSGLHLDLAADNLADIALPAADVAFFCAAIASFAACRADPVLARRVNVDAPALLAARLAERGTHIVGLSSSSVFDWSQPLVPADKPTCPTSIYGRLKAESEAALLKLGDTATIVRFAKVLTPDAKLFLDWRQAQQEGRSVTAFSDLRMAPIGLDDAVELLLALAAAPQPGLFQYSSRTDISYLETARHLAARLGASPDTVVEARAADAGIPPEEITYYSSLDPSRAERLLGHPAPDPYATLDRLFGLTDGPSGQRHGAAS